MGATVTALSADEEGAYLSFGIVLFDIRRLAQHDESFARRVEQNANSVQVPSNRGISLKNAASAISL